MKIQFIAIVLLIIPHTLQSTVPPLPNLSHRDADLRKLRAEVKRNMAGFVHDNTMRLRWRRYRVQKRDTFFIIMARTMLNHDTLSSVNRLVSLWDIRGGETWLIPNMRGIALYGEPAKLAARFKVSAHMVVPVPGKKGLYFVAGQKFEAGERFYFNLTAFMRPVAGNVSSKYGMRADPFHKKPRFHTGLDIACAMRSRVKASASGKVIHVGALGAYGRTIIIEHSNGYQTLYGHLSSYHVKKGQSVNQGDSIGLSGDSGRATGPHVHFEVRRSGRAISPKFNQHLSRRAQKKPSQRR